MTVELTFRPLVTKWPKKPLDHGDRRASGWSFKKGAAGWIGHLERELDHLNVREALVEVDAPAASFKKYGGLFADGPVHTPKVMLTFDLPDVGALRYACDTYRWWQDNLHAIGLTLERLRLVDTYGATTGHEQYRGFKALPGAGESSEEREMTVGEAAAQLVAVDPQWARFEATVRSSIENNVLADQAIAKTVALAAVRATHPDTGGTPEAFAIVQRARAVLSKHFGEGV